MDGAFLPFQVARKRVARDCQRHSLAGRFAMQAAPSVLGGSAASLASIDTGYRRACSPEFIDAGGTASCLGCCICEFLKAVDRMKGKPGFVGRWIKANAEIANCHEDPTLGRRVRQETRLTFSGFAEGKGPERRGGRPAKQLPGSLGHVGDPDPGNPQPRCPAPSEIKKSRRSGILLRSETKMAPQGPGELEKLRREQPDKVGFHISYSLQFRIIYTGFCPGMARSRTGEPRLGGGVGLRPPNLLPSPNPTSRRRPGANASPTIFHRLSRA